MHTHIHCNVVNVGAEAPPWMVAYAISVFTHSAQLIMMFTSTQTLKIKHKYLYNTEYQTNSRVFCTMPIPFQPLDLERICECSIKLLLTSIDETITATKKAYILISALSRFGRLADTSDDVNKMRVCGVQSMAIESCILHRHKILMALRILMD